MSKDLYFDFKAEEMATMYAPTFTKKEAILTGKRMVDDLLESGEIDKMQFMSNLCRLTDVVNSANDELRKHLPLEKLHINGVEFTPVNGGDTLNLKEDPIYCQLKQDLDDRAELLKLAQKQTVIDAYGNDVPKVGTTPRKSSITIKY